MSQQRVMTEFGPGVIVASEKVRGTTSYKIEGPGFSIWREAQQIPEFGQLQWDQSEDHRWDNSTTLPYNPRPQFYPHDGQSTIQPNQHVDPEQRLRPADSVSFEERAENNAPGPAPNLFAATELEEIQERLGPKFAHIPRNVDHGSLQARLDRDPYLVFSEIASNNAVNRRAQNHLVARQMDLEDADPELRTAAWADVRAKAIRLRRSGNIALEAANPQAIVATVTGDHGIYDVAVIKGNAINGSSAVTDWTCSCPWGEHAFDRTTFVGRLCSHAYAALLELQSITQRKDKPYGWNDKVSARYPDPDGKLQTEPGTMTPDLHHIPKVRHRTRIDVTAGLTEAEIEILEKAGYLTEPFQGTGPAPKHEWSTSADAVERMDEHHLHVDVDGPGGNPAQPNGDDVVTAAYANGDYTALTEAAVANGWEVDERHDPMFGEIKSSSFRKGSDFVIWVGYQKPPGMIGKLESATLSTQDALGNAYSGLADADDVLTVRGWLENPDRYVTAGTHVAESYNPVDDGGDATVVDVEAETGDGEDIVAKFQREAGAYLMDGSDSAGGNDDIAAAAAAYLNTKTAGRQFTLAEQQALIDEDPDGGPLDPSELDLRGTHYLP